MGIFSKNKPAAQASPNKILKLAKICSPILGALYYVSIVVIVLLGIIALIMLLVNTSVENMMLPPFMSVHGEEYYSITIGNGIRIDAPYNDVTLGDIKTVIYAQLMMLAATLCMIAPISLFLSKFFKNFSGGREYDAVNVRYIKYIALTVMVGSTFVRVFRNIYNCLLVKTFVSNPEVIRFAFGLDLGGIALGILIFIFAFSYKNLCDKSSNMPAIVPEA